MNRSQISLLPAALITAALLFSADRAIAQEIGLAPLDVKEVARGYRAEALRLKPVANEKHQVLGRISDFIFSKDGSDIFVVLAVDDLSGPGSHLIAIPFQRIKLDDPSGYLVLPGASAAALDKLPVFAYNR
jgi:hypothetical protein